MKPVSIALLVVSTSFLAFYAGRQSVKGACGAHGADSTRQLVVEPHLDAPTQAEDRVAAVSGRVAEIIQVPNYTYLRLRTPKGDTWAAVATTTTIAKGDAATLVNAMPMSGFTSPTLERTFATIYFGELSPL